MNFYPYLLLLITFFVTIQSAVVTVQNLHTLDALQKVQQQGIQKVVMIVPNKCLTCNLILDVIKQTITSMNIIEKVNVYTVNYSEAKEIKIKIYDVNGLFKIQLVGQHTKPTMVKFIKANLNSNPIKIQSTNGYQVQKLGQNANIIKNQKIETIEKQINAILEQQQTPSYQNKQKTKATKIIKTVSIKSTKDKKLQTQHLRFQKTQTQKTKRIFNRLDKQTSTKQLKAKIQTIDVTIKPPLIEKQPETFKIEYLFYLSLLLVSCFIIYLIKTQRSQRNKFMRLNTNEF